MVSSPSNAFAKSSQNATSCSPNSSTRRMRASSFASVNNSSIASLSPVTALYICSPSSTGSSPYVATSWSFAAPAASCPSSSRAFGSPKMAVATRLALSTVSSPNFLSSCSLRNDKFRSEYNTSTPARIFSCRDFSSKPLILSYAVDANS